MIKKSLILGLSTLIVACSISPHHAVSSNDLKYLKNLPSSEINKGPWESSDWTPFHVAAAQNKIAAMDILLSKGADPSAYSSTMGVAPIHLAVANGHVEVVKKLIALRVDVNVKNKLGASPLELSIINGNMAIFEILMKSAVNIEQKNNNGFSALASAVSEGKLLMARDLIKMGADVESVQSRGFTPLIISVITQNEQMANLLIDAQADLNRQSHFGDTALHWAADKKDRAILKLLIDSGADISIQNSSGKTAKELLAGIHSLTSLFPSDLKKRPNKPDTGKKQFKPENQSKPLVLKGSGSSFFVNREGGLITNFHVIDQCKQVKVFSDSKERNAKVVHIDYKNDLAYLVAPDLVEQNYISVTNEQQQLGEKLVILGYPLRGLMGNSIKLTDGSLSAHTGLRGDSSKYQVSVPIQAGNSGGPVFNESGLVIGVATSSLSASYMLKSRDDIPQNVNFAVKSSILSEFMKANKIPFDQKMNTNKVKSPKEVYSEYSDSVAIVLCYQ